MQKHNWKTIYVAHTYILKFLENYHKFIGFPFHYMADPQNVKQNKKYRTCSFCMISILHIFHLCVFIQAFVCLQRIC